MTEWVKEIKIVNLSLGHYNENDAVHDSDVTAVNQYLEEGWRLIKIVESSKVAMLGNGYYTVANAYAILGR